MVKRKGPKKVKQEYGADKEVFSLDLNRLELEELCDVMEHMPADLMNEDLLQRVRELLGWYQCPHCGEYLSPDDLPELAQ